MSPCLHAAGHIQVLQGRAAARHPRETDIRHGVTSPHVEPLEPRATLTQPLDIFAEQPKLTGNGMGIG